MLQYNVLFCRASFMSFGEWTGMFSLLFFILRLWDFVSADGAFCCPIFAVYLRTSWWRSSYTAHSAASSFMNDVERQIIFRSLLLCLLSFNWIILHFLLLVSLYLPSWLVFSRRTLILHYMLISVCWCLLWFLTSVTNQFFIWLRTMWTMF